MKKLLLVSLCFLMLCITQVYAQNRTITGTVTSKDDGLPLPGVSVTVTGTSVGTQTNASGKFSLSVPATAKSLSFSFIGFQRQEVNIGAGSNMNVVLSATANQLSEVIVQSAGGLAVKRREQGYASTTVKARELTQGKATNVGAALSGKVAGLQVNTVGSGVNPTVRLVLRGNRSLLGNNQALVVIDNVIVPSSILGNINPEDIEDIQVLNGAGAAALYGSDASNGALLITTKKGRKGETSIRVSNSTSFEHVSYNPKTQTEFGSGSNTDVQLYIPFENQQYGPRFDGSIVEIGRPLPDGTIQKVRYSANDGKNQFWNTGVLNQTDIALSSGSESSTFYLSGQYVTQKGTTPHDAYNRASIRANGTRKINDRINVTYSANYVQNRYNTTTQTGSVYDQLLQTPPHINITDYKDWQNNIWANPNNYYNEYYPNPYFTIDNNRQNIRNDYFVGQTELKWNPISWLTFTGRVGITASNQSYKSYTNKFVLDAYTKSIATASVKRNDIPGSVENGSNFATQLVSDFLATFDKRYNKLNVTFTAGAGIRDNNGQTQTINASGLIQRDLLNVNQRYTANTGGTQFDARRRQQSIYGDLKLSYEDYLTLHVTGRNDWLSVLAPENRSFFYPAADVAFTPTNLIESLKGSNILNALKIRAGVSKVGQANIDPYALNTTFSQSNGYPYSTGPGYGFSGRVVSNSLRPEITKGYEFGFDADLIDNRVTASATYYSTQTTNQTVPAGLSTASGFSSYLVNTGRVDNNGIETALFITPLRTASGWTLTLGANYTHVTNKVAYISDQIEKLALSSGGNAQVYAIKGQPYPMLLGSDYLRDDQGRVIVDATTGYPSANPVQVQLGNTQPKDRLGLNVELRYKSFRFAALAEYRGGFVIFNSSGSFDFSGAGLRTVYYDRERFVFPNSSYLDPATNQYVANTNITVADGANGFFADNNRNLNIASNYVTSAASWKLREVSLQYDLPKSLFGNGKYIKGATVGLQGRNLFLWLPKSNIYTDPEYSFTDSNAIGINTLGQTPPTRYYGATVSVNF
ncbi:SusC/RagA family TonB-linked outer membrane protein [Mucilaginibacter sp. AK015]|uniref:SusC/RagA family TonB-linked outer membrane protein n=1 Tax=Mucilaginibacter sp. AK015 TaxID=2723072 RepID=UPI001607F8F8|nr:SusC/RagA family TonB-linked outer membrane protein [Mucilaginibacter sp. AK015]MBB5397424.1 TonB-linked SusC/RagA family outer membrane protein [Mucilaginibacter sp. AK015]